MMGWFGPKLEPGERVILQDPAAGVQWLMRIAGAFLPVALAWSLMDILARGNWLPTALYLGAGLIFLSMVRTTAGREAFRWQTAITERRLICRSGVGSAGYEAIPLAEIEMVEESDLSGQRMPAGAGLSSDTTPAETRRLAELAARLPEPTAAHLRHGDRVFSLAIGKRKAERIRTAIASARETA